MNNLGYLFAVFVIVWLTIFVYTLTFMNRQKKLSKEIDSLKEILSEKRNKESNL